MDVLLAGDYARLGEMMKISHDGDRITGNFPMRVTDDYLIRAAEEEADIALQPGAYHCSVPEIDGIIDMLCETEGVFGAQMLGAGLGGSFAALVEADKVEAVIVKLNKEYYDKHGYQHLARVYKPARGSSIEF